MLGEQALLAIVHPHAVRAAEARRRQPQARQILDVRHAAGQVPHDRDLVARFGGVRVHERLVRIRQAGHGLEQRGRARDGEARRERGAQPSLRGAVPPFAERHALVDRRVRLSRASARARRRRRPSCTCRSSRGCPLRPRLRTPHRSRAPSPSSARWWCRRRAARRCRAARPHGASTACVPLPSARRACAPSPSGSGRRRSPGRASGRGARVSARSREAPSRRARR